VRVQGYQRSIKTSVLQWHGWHTRSLASLHDFIIQGANLCVKEEQVVVMVPCGDLLLKSSSRNSR
jgi:hypothetical protein